MPISQSQRLAMIAELNARGVDTSGFAVSQPGPAAKSPTFVADQKRVTDMHSVTDDAKGMAGLVNDFAIRNDRTKTGGMLRIPFASATAQALGTKGSDDLGLMDADSMQAATRMRAPGMRLTQMEFQKFLGGVPEVQKARSANRPFQERANNASVMAQAQSTFYDHYLRRMGSLSGADEAWTQFSNQHFDPEGKFSLAPRAQANAALKAQSAGGGAGPKLLGYE